MPPTLTRRLKTAVRPPLRVRELRRLQRLAGARRRKRPIALVVGNCQASPLATLLTQDEQFAARWDLVRLPAAHEITSAELDLVRSSLPRVGLLVSQAIRDDYRGLPVGLDQLVALLPRDATVVTYPVMYFEGLFPFQIYIRTVGELSQVAPVTDYGDLRFLGFAARGLTEQHAATALRDYVAPPEAVREQQDRSLAELRRREESLSVGVSDRLALPGATRPDFHTVNHPSNSVLEAVADRVLASLGGSGRTPVSGSRELLGRLLTPVSADVVGPLGSAVPVREDWTVRGKRVTEREVLAAHYAWFARDPDVVRLGAVQHEERLTRFGLL